MSQSKNKPLSGNLRTPDALTLCGEAYTDVVELCALLQCLGFSVKSLESSDGNNSQAESGTRTVVINCQSSGLHVVLETPSANCSCPATNQQQTSGVWQVSGVTGGKQLDKEFGCSLLGSLPEKHRDRLTKQLHEIIRCIRQHNESDTDKVKDDKSASMTDLKTPEKKLFDLKSETPTRYRSLDTLTAAKEAEQQLPAPGILQRAHLVSESSGDDVKDSQRMMCSRQGTYTLPSQCPSASMRHRNKTSSPIHTPQNSLLESLVEAEKAAEELRNKLGFAINEYMDQFKNDSSISSLALDVSKISVLKGESSKPQFASSPNLSGILATDDFTKSRLKRFESASTSNLALKTPKEGKISRLRRISPNIFKRKESPSIKVEKTKSQDNKSKLNCLLRPRIVTPIRTYKTTPMPEPSQNLSTSYSSKKKFSHVKSTIPRPAKKE